MKLGCPLMPMNMTRILEMEIVLGYCMMIPGWLLWTKSKTCSDISREWNYNGGSSILEVQDYGVMEWVWSQRDLASTYVLCYYHALVPNFGDWSIRVCLEAQTKKRTQKGL